MDALMNMVNSLLRLLGLVVVLAIALKIFLLWWNSPKQKGERGEDGGEMVLRKRKGDGKSFCGCKSYPKCRGTVNVE